MLKFLFKDFYVMDKALSGELSCPCDRSCLQFLLSRLQLAEMRHLCCFSSVVGGGNGVNLCLFYVVSSVL